MFAGTHMERFILENSEDVFRELQKPIEEAFSAIFSQISARIFDQVPYKTIFVS
jgi:Haemolymph juvenile hormone binding protein (JHBP)